MKRPLRFYVICLMLFVMLCSVCAIQANAQISPTIRVLLKRLKLEEQLAICRRYGLDVDEEERKSAALLHSKTAAALARYVYGEDEEGYLSDVKPEVIPNNLFVEELRHFVECLNTGKTPISPMEDALTVQKMLDAIYRSAEAHAEVTI